MSETDGVSAITTQITSANSLTPNSVGPQPVGPDPTAIPATVNKEELKGLLHDIVKDIHTDKTSQEAIDRLVQEVAIAKNDFLNVIKKVEQTIENLGLLKENK